MKQLKDSGFIRRIVALGVIVLIVLIIFVVRLVQFQTSAQNAPVSSLAGSTTQIVSE